MLNGFDAPQSMEHVPEMTAGLGHEMCIVVHAQQDAEAVENFSTRAP